MQIAKPQYRLFFMFVFAIASVLFLSSWISPLTPGSIYKFFNGTDTIPKSKDAKIIELNEAIAQLQKATQELKERDIAAEISKAIADIDFDEINANVDEAMLQAQSALEKVDVQKIKEKVAMALEKIDKEKIDRQVKEATANLQPQIQKSLEEARQELQQALKELEANKKKKEKL